MDFTQAVEAAPPGWRHFTIDDIDRLPRAVREREMARLPESERGLLAHRDEGAIERVRRAFFWTLIYHLEPQRWDALAEAEPIHPEILNALPSRVPRALDIGAGSGRLTRHLVERSQSVIAVEPSAGLRKLLATRLPSVVVIPGWAEALPLSDGSAELTVACGAFGPDPTVLDEMTRVTAAGGVIALISPECPEWFEAHGWRRLSVSPLPTPPHPGWLDELFGPPDPPHELVLTSKT
jgi:SAM-dependent methyltransferase